MAGDCLKRAGESKQAIAAFSLAVETFEGTYAYRSALEMARLFRKQKETAKSDAAYQLAFKELSKPKEKQDDFPSLLKYLMNMEPRYSSLVHGSEVLHTR